MIRAMSGAGRQARASCDRVLRWRKALWKSQARTSRHLSPPKRLARVARLPAPTLAAQLQTGDPSATHLSAFSEATGTLPLHVFRSHAGRPLRRYGKRGAASRRSSVSSRRLWGAHSSVVANSHDHAVDLTVETVANQQSAGLPKQQRGA